MTAPAIDRVDAFHQLGTDVRDTRDAYDALTRAGLSGWNIVKEPLRTERGYPVSGQHALVHGATGRPLPGIAVGDQYTVVQFEDNADLLDAVAERTGARLDVAAQLSHDGRAYLYMSFPEPIVVGGVDTLATGIACFMGHGGASNLFAPTATRIWCANQQHQVAAGNRHKVVMRHTRNVHDRMAVAENTLVATVASMRDYRHEAEAMISQPVTDAEFRRIIERLYPLGGDSNAAQTRFERRVGTMRYLFSEAEHNAPIAGTAWGAYQSVIEYGEHFQTVRGGDGASISDARAQRALLSATLEADQHRAFAAFRELCN